MYSYTGHHSARKNYKKKSWALEVKRKHPAEKAERRDSSVTAARYKNERGSGLHWTNLSALPSVFLWASLARAQASVVDILLQAELLGRYAYFSGFGWETVCSYHPLSDLSSWSWRLSANPPTPPCKPLLFLFLLLSFLLLVFSPQEHLFWA